MRATLSLYWVRRGVTTLPCPLLTGAAALAAEVRWTRAVWIEHFLDAVAAEAAHGLALLRLLERSWFYARQAGAGRRRDSHAAAAIDLLAVASLLSTTSLAELFGIAVKNAIRLLDGFVVLGIATEVTHRAKRRLYGLRHLAPLREVTAPARRLQPGHRPGRPSGAVTGLVGPIPTVTLVANSAAPLPDLTRHSSAKLKAPARAGLPRCQPVNRRRTPNSPPVSTVVSPAAIRGVGARLTDHRRGISRRIAHFSEKPGQPGSRFRLRVPRRRPAELPRTAPST